MNDLERARRAASAGEEEDGADLLDLAIVLGRHKRMIALCPLVASVLVGLVSLLIPNTYTGVTRALVPQQNQSTATAMLSQLGGLAGLAAGASGLKNPGDTFIQMLKSNTVADALVSRFDLKALYKQKLLVDARKSLWARSRFSADRSGIMTIEVDARDPKLAADMANAYVEELYKLTGTLAVTEAAQRRLFFERQLQQTKDKLADAEVELRQAMDTSGLVSVDAQGRAAVETVARLRANISVKEVQIGAMRAYATPDNPDMRRAEEELASLRRELSRLETGTGTGAEAGAGSGDGKDEAKTGAKGMNNVRLLRNVKYYEAVFEALAKQYEIARLDESKDAPVIQVMDKAVPPERKSKPHRGQLVLAAFVIGLLLGVLGAFVRQALESARADPARREKLAALRSTWLRGS
jgi:uncharacterized protein involved in exopolysaccharide biosynthesis